MECNWQLKTFDELSIAELYEIMNFRQKIFIVEQDCLFVDADYKDQLAYHLIGRENDAVIAYSRIIAPGKVYKEASIGRVSTEFHHRHHGLGHELMKKSIEYSEELFKGKDIKIQAQEYLKKFYEEHNFKSLGDPYLEDGILHVDMVRYYKL